MSRRDKTTKERHALRHEGKALSQINIQNFDKQGEKISLARQKYYPSCKTTTTSKAIKRTQPELNLCQSLQKSSNTVLLPATASSTSKEKEIEVNSEPVEVKHSEESKDQFVASIKEDIAALNSKIDDVTKAIKEMTVDKTVEHIKNNSTLATAVAVGMQNTDLPDWKNITNIAELTKVISAICFYAGDENGNFPSVI